MRYRWPTGSPVPTRRILLSPDEGGSGGAGDGGDGSGDGNAGDAKGDAKGDGNGTKGPDAASLVSQGVSLGQRQLFEQFEVKDTDELDELIRLGREARKVGTKDEGDKGKKDGKGGDDEISDHPDYLKVTTELGETKRQSDKLRVENERLAKLADEARREKIRSAALKAGVGPKQSDAFLSLFSGRFRLGEDGSLQTLGQLADGTMAPLGQSSEELIKEILAEHDYLVAPEPAGGVGSKVRGGRSAPSGNKSIWGTGGNKSRLDTVLGGTK